MPTTAPHDPLHAQAEPVVTDLDPQALLKHAWAHHDGDPARLAGITNQLVMLAAANEAGDVDRFWAHLTRGLLAFRLMPPEQVQSDLRVVTELLPRVHEARAWRLQAAFEATALLPQGHFADAFERVIGMPLLSDAQHDDPDDYFVLYGRSVCAIFLGRIEDAFGALYAAVALTQRTGPRVRHCAAVCNLTGMLCTIDRPAEAVELLEPLIASQSWGSNQRLWGCAHSNLALAQMLCDRLEEAHAGFEAVVDAGLARQSEFTAYCYENLVNTSIRLGRLDDAERYLALCSAAAQASGMESTRGESLIDAGRIACARGRTGDAVVLLEQAWACFDKDPALNITNYSRTHLGEMLAACHETLGDYERAFACYRRFHAMYRERADYVNRGQLAALEVRHGLAQALYQLEAERGFALARERKLHTQARRDALTGLYNRRYLDETLPELIAVARRDGHQLAVAIIDLDHFKRINDSFGHAGGDKALRAFARIAESTVRESDCACRYGGEEFCVVLLNCTRADAVRRLEAMLSGFKQAQVRHEDAVVGPLSFSAGLALFPTDADDVESLLRVSDRRVYEAKEAGRGRVEAG